MSMKVLQPGLLTSIQDLGRYGYQKHGVIVSGAMDTYSLRLANLLVGNEEGEAGLEITLMGPSFLIEQDTLLAISGGDLSPSIDEESIPMWRPVYIKGGSVLRFGTCKSGCRSYIAVAGGFNIPEVMGSKSTYLRAGLGGFHGRALKEEDVLELNTPSEQAVHTMKGLEAKAGERPFVPTSWYIERGCIPQDTGHTMVRVMHGSQFELFDEDSITTFFNEPFQVTPQSDRMGYRLSGPVLKLKKPVEMISEAVSLGTVQIPPDGNPILLLADRQTVGGYPKIAQVAAVDISVIAQMKPGKKLTFQEITVEEAERLYMVREKHIQSLKLRMKLKGIIR